MLSKEIHKSARPNTLTLDTAFEYLAYMEKQELNAHVGTKRNFEEGSPSERREKRQKMPRNTTNDSNDKKDSTKKKEIEERKRIATRLRKEAMKEIQPIAIGSLAMVASTISNQGECMSLVGATPASALRTIMK